MKANNIFFKGLLIFFLFLTVSCNNKKESLPFNVIPLESAVGNYSMLNLSDYIEEIKYIPLETNDSVLIGRIANSFSYENGKIFMANVSGSNLYYYLFDDKGSFLRKIGNHGQGPDDYLGTRNTYLLDNYIYILDSSGKKLLIYDTDGFLIENIRFKTEELTGKSFGYFHYNIYPLKKDTFVLDVGAPFGYYPKAILLEKDQSNFKIIKEYSNYIKTDKKPGDEILIGRGFMYRFKDDVRLFEFTKNDTIFTIGQNLELTEAFTFESGKYRYLPSVFKRDEAYNYIRLGSVFESFDHLFITFDFGNHAPEPFEITNRINIRVPITNVKGVFDKNTGKLFLMKQPIKGKLGFKNDIDNGPVIWPHYISSQNELVTYISAEEFLDYYEKIENPTPQMTEIAKNVKIDDNPIVIIAKLKEKTHGTK